MFLSFQNLNVCFLRLVLYIQILMYRNLDFLVKMAPVGVLLVSQFVIFKPLSYCFEETIGFDVKASFASRPESRLIRWYNEPADITKEFW